ncbi:MAG: HlyD family efflux transporter periplasmic adaptor subunit [Clostridia bacterium]|nr:HlyD family efflux transporter periplasmic adaptor subunit [Clostridia bacterium]
MKKKKKKPVIAIYLLILVVLYIIIYIIPKVSGALQPTYNITYGEMKLSDKTTGYVVRNEQLYVSGHGGSTNYYIKEGDLLRAGTTVMNVEGSTEGEARGKYSDILENIGDDAITTESYNVEKGGVVCYYADGYESKLSSKTMRKKDKEFYSKLSQNSVIALNRKDVNEGEPVFKIVDRTRWYLVCYVPKDHRERYDIGGEVTVELDGTELDATVCSIKREDDENRIILTTDHFYDEFGKLRVIKNVELITYDQRGLLVENKSITEKKGQQGVYVQDKVGKASFVPIKVIKSDGEMSLVCDTIFYDDKGNETYTVEIYDEVLRKPES